MDSPQASRLVVSIFATQHLEMDGRTALDTLPLFIELEMRGCDAAKVLPQVWRHIQVSAHCRDVYEALRAIAEMECADCLPHPDFRSLFND
jgi:hypothetical protein